MHPSHPHTPTHTPTHIPLALPLYLSSHSHSRTAVCPSPPLSTQRWFAQYEFTAPYLLCCSDCTALSMRQLLAMADDDSLQLWDELSLGYTEAPGLPALRQEIAGCVKMPWIARSSSHMDPLQA